MGQEITKNIVSKKGKAYSSKKSLLPLSTKSIVEDPSKWKPNISDISKIISLEMPKTLEDIFERRIGISSSQEWDKLYPDKNFNEFSKQVQDLINQQIES